MRCDPQQQGAFLQRLADEAELGRLEIAQSTVDQFARLRRGTGRHRSFLEEQDAPTGGCGALGDADAVDATTDDTEVVLLA